MTRIKEKRINRTVIVPTIDASRTLSGEKGTPRTASRMVDMKGATLEWRAHPARERIGAAVIASLVILTIAGAVFFSFHSVPWSVASMLLLLLSLNRFYFPSRFTIDSQRVTATYLFRRQSCAWGKIIRFRHDANGAYLSTRDRPSRLDPFRGMHILFGREKEAVIPRITRFMREAGTR